MFCITLKIRKLNFVQPGGVAAVAVVAYPDAVVLVVHADGFRIPVGEIAHIVSVQQLAAIAVEKVKRETKILGPILVGVGIKDPQTVAYGVIAEVANLGDGGSDIPQALLPKLRAVKLVLKQLRTCLRAEVQVPLVPGDALATGVAHILHAFDLD